MGAVTNDQGCVDPRVDGERDRLPGVVEVELAAAGFWWKPRFPKAIEELREQLRGETAAPAHRDGKFVGPHTYRAEFVAQRVGPHSDCRCTHVCRGAMVD